MGLNFFNSKIFGVTEDFQTAYVTYTDFVRNDIDCELLHVDKNTAFFNMMYNSRRYLAPNFVHNFDTTSHILFILRVSRKDYSSAEKLYQELIKV